LQQWQAEGIVLSFSLGQHDVSDQFEIPERLYGRDAEIASLLETFGRVSDGTTELLLVTGALRPFGRNDILPH
jgi:hypothetical protein